MSTIQQTKTEIALLVSGKAGMLQCEVAECLPAELRIFDIDAIINDLVYTGSIVRLEVKLSYEDERLVTYLFPQCSRFKLSCGHTEPQHVDAS